MPAICMQCDTEHPGAPVVGACRGCGGPLALQDRLVAVRRLGGGRTSRVHEVVDLRGGGRYALKTLSLDESDDPFRAQEMFQRQYDLLSQLEHPGLPRVHESFRGPNRRYLLQELVEGGSLQDAIAQGRRCDEAGARKLLHELLDVLGYLHGLSPLVLHRDVKPANVLLRADGTPVLIDFDTARGAGVDHAMADGTMVGTAGYVPMEQLAGRPVPASDLYALGMTMIAVLSHRSITEIPISRMKVQFQPLVHVSPALVRVLEKLTEPAVEDRYQTVAEVRAALRAPFVPDAGSRRSATPLPETETASPGGREIERYRELARLSAALAPSAFASYRPSDGLDRLSQVAFSDDGAAMVLQGERSDALEVCDTGAMRTRPCGIAPHIASHVVLAADGAVAMTGSFSEWTLHHLLSPRAEHRCELRLDSSLGMMLMGGFRGGIALRPDGDVLAILVEGKVLLHDARSGKQIQEIPFAQDRIEIMSARGLRFSPDGAVLVVDLDYKGTLLLGADGDPQRAPMRALALDREGRRAAFGSDKAVKIGMLKGLTPLAWERAPATLWVGEDDIEHLRFSPDGRWIAVSDRAHRIALLDARTGRPAMVPTQPHLPGARLDDVDGFGFSADGDRLFVHGECVLQPGGEPEDGVAIYSISRREPLGTLGSGPVGVTVEGRHAKLSGKGKEAEHVRQCLLGHPLDEILSGPALDASRELGLRLHAWGSAVADGRVLGVDLIEAIEASRGSAHLLPVAIEQVFAQQGSGPARLGDAIPRGTRLPTERVLEGLRALERLAASERADRFEASLPAIAAAAEAREPRAPATEPGAAGFWQRVGAFFASLVGGDAR